VIGQWHVDGLLLLDLVYFRWFVLMWRIGLQNLDHQRFDAYGVDAGGFDLIWRNA
jgi:hypothetical protein